MDEALYKAVVTNDRPAFLGLVQENNSLLGQRVSGYEDTVLHLATRLGHTELVSEIIGLSREMVSSENFRRETPLHIACFNGNFEIVKLLLAVDPWVASRLDCENQSSTFLACINGHLDAAELCLQQPGVVPFEETKAALCLRVTIAKGFTGIAKKLLTLYPNYTWKADENGFIPLHYAARESNFEITKLILEQDSSLATQFNNHGYTPLHLAAAEAATHEILKEFLSRAPLSFNVFTRDGDTVFHLLARSGKVDAFKFLAPIFNNNTNLLRQSDQYGNTVLHLALCAHCYPLAEYIINETRVDPNQRNVGGYTAMDILNQAEKTPQIQHLQEILEQACRKMSQPAAIKVMNAHTWAPDDRADPVVYPGQNVMTNGDLSVDGKQDLKNTEDIYEEDADVHQGDYNSSSSDRKSKEKKRRRSHQHGKKQPRQRPKDPKVKDRKDRTRSEIYTEAMQNARNTVSLVCILIATVAFTAGMNPPGGVFNEGPLTGKTTVGKKMSFFIFQVSNNLALFLSLGIVIFILTVIPKEEKPLRKILAITHKFMWAALVCMAVAYVAATWVILPRNGLGKWELGIQLVIICSTMGILVVWSAFLSLKQWRVNRNRKKKKKNENGGGNIRRVHVPSGKQRPRSGSDCCCYSCLAKISCYCSNSSSSGYCTIVSSSN